ncbi:lamin tail domain-containing protein, partial [candidate division KSB1 bacterium]|nr:lamin tail domain-containing protein [candidate division KSB1 bacterium]
MDCKWIWGILLESVVMLWAGRSFPQIVLSEIMFNPIGNERYDEFIEIYNTSETDTIDLQGWLLSDGGGYNQIRDYQQGTQLQPGTFAVIFVPNYYLHSGYYDVNIPAEALRLTIDKSTLGSYGLNNTRSETVSIFTPDSALISSYAYSIPNEDGISEEKILLTGGDQPDNWSHSLVVDGTPGAPNSVSPYEYDLALKESTCRIKPVSSDPADSVSAIFWIYNLGLRQALNFRISIFWDMNRDGEPQAAESLRVVMPEPQPIQPLDSLQCRCMLGPLPPGDHTVWLFLYYPLDQNINNNSVEMIVQVSGPPPRVWLNECLPEPDPGYGWWIEIYNADSVQVELTGYQLLCSEAGERIILDDPSLQLQPGHFMLISVAPNLQDRYWQPPCPIIIKDCHWPSVWQTPFSLTLLNASGEIVDTLTWQSTTRPGVSIERSGTNHIWDYCIHPSGATPGARNSIEAPYADAALRPLSLNITPETGQMECPIHFDLWVHNYGTQVLSSGKIGWYIISTNQSIPDTTLIKMVDMVQSIAPMDSMLFSFDSEPCEPKLYRYYFELYSEEDVYPMNNSVELDIRVPYRTGALVINELFYNTEEKQQEWIEIYNPSTVTIDLAGCKIKDARKTVVIEENAFKISPGDFLVLSNQLFSDPGNPEMVPIILEGLPEMNNSGDQIVLLSPQDHCIDSVAYTSSWGGARFVSLERVRWEEDSNDPNNWCSCIDTAGATPGRMNSCSPKRIDASVVPNSLAIQ